MKRSDFNWGIFLIIIGAGFLLYRFFPGLFIGLGWPWILVIIGIGFGAISLGSRQGGLMIPACILMALGGVLLFQFATGDGSMWAYMWGIFPGAVGLGMLIGGLYDDEMRGERRTGLGLFLGGLFAILFFGGFFGAGILRTYWPLLFIVAGIALVVRARFGHDVPQVDAPQVADDAVDRAVGDEIKMLKDEERAKQS